jgi:hypothetical protein
MFMILILQSIVVFEIITQCNMLSAANISV